MRWLAALLGLCLLGGLAASWLAWSRSDVGPPPPVADPVGVPTAEPGAAVETAEDMHPANADLDQVEQPADRDAEAERVDAEPPVDPTRAPRVQVVRDNPPVAVADAVVHYVTREQAEVFLRARKQTMPRYEWPEALGQRVRTGADGIVQLPATETPWLCAASLGDEFAFTAVPPGERLVVMHLVLDETVTVHATCADDRPVAFLPIALLQRAGNGEVRTVWQGEAAANGRAVVRHFQLVLERQPAEKRESPPRYAALAMAPLPAPVAVEFARPVPREPIRLCLPPIGGLEVLLTDHRGTPLLSPAVVIAQVERKEEPTQPFPFAAGLTNRRQQKPVGAEPVSLPFIGASTPLRVVARFPHDRRAAQLSPLTGPGQADEQKRVTLPLAPHHVVLAGRLLLPTRAPVATATWPAVLWRADRDLETCTLHTIADGRFDLVLGTRSDATEYWLEVAAVPYLIDLHEGKHDEAVLGARVHVPGLPGGQRIELGDIVLGEAPVLTSGEVVDDQGQPVPDASVNVQQEEPARPGRNEPNRDPWRNLPLLATKTGPDGTFAMFGSFPPGRLRVRADTDLHFADSVPLQSQGQQLRIRIDRNGILNGRVLLPDWVADGTVTLTMRPFDEQQQKRDTRSVGLGRRGGGRFTVQPL
ncbi:MAG TPA: carboxypeptidase-like regulatory domain-containing protein, partial [Planctomycetota bacterium]|nr:carboxypeptidase-like regulatory domain-containing protein [Planctomycetota bacterium]